jgi:hypothetical protein
MTDLDISVDSRLRIKPVSDQVGFVNYNIATSNLERTPRTIVKSWDRLKMLRSAFLILLAIHKTPLLGALCELVVSLRDLHH